MKVNRPHPHPFFTARSSPFARSALWTLWLLSALCVPLRIRVHRVHPWL